MRCRILASFLLIFTFVLSPLGAPAAPGPALAGDVTAIDGTPVPGALVTVSSPKNSATASSDASGHFVLARVTPGAYSVTVRASGYAPASGRTITVRAGATTALQVTLAKQQVSSLTTIADVRVNGVSTLSTVPAPSVNLNAQHYAAQGVTRTSDLLSNELSTTVIPILGGGLNAPAVVALRGPDPSETLVDVDGHQVNNGSTGDFDLSLLDPADLQYVQVVYGIAPSSLYGPNTLGGALNVVTLEPTQQPHTLERFSFGSFGTQAGTLQATGTDGRLGYAFSMRRFLSAGQLNDTPFPNTSDDDTNLSTGTSPIGNGMNATSEIAKLRYAFPNGGFAGITFEGQSVYRDLSATLSSEWLAQDGSPGGVTTYDNASGSSVASNNNAYGLDLQLPIGRRDATGAAPVTATFRHQTSFVQQSVNGEAAGSSPYLYNDRDLIADDTLEFVRALPKGSLSIKFAATGESLTTDNILGTIDSDSVARRPESMALRPASLSPQDSVTNGNPDATIADLSQTQRWVGLRYTDDPTEQLHYSLATYYSDYSSFGHSLDPRMGFVWTPKPDSALRFSVGSTFQSPQLPTFLVPGPNVPITVVGGYVSIGNPNATAERSTAYDLGYEHLFHIPGHQLRLAMDLYRNDLHNGVATFIGSAPCTTPTVTLAENPTCLTYPVNVASEVYQGFELHADVALAARTTLHAGYDIDSVFTRDTPADALDDVAVYEQALGVPLHKATLTIEHDPNAGLSYYAGLLYEGQYNELNLPPFATLRAGATWHLPHFDIGITGENLTNAYNFQVLRTQGGVPYGVYQDSPTLPDAIPLAGRRFSLILTHKM